MVVMVVVVVVANMMLIIIRSSLTPVTRARTMVVIRDMSSTVACASP